MDAALLLERLKSFKNEIKREFKCSKCRSKIIENLEGIKDCLTKIIDRSKQDLINKINTFWNELHNLKGQLIQMETREDNEQIFDF